AARRSPGGAPGLPGHRGRRRRAGHRPLHVPGQAGVRGGGPGAGVGVRQRVLVLRVDPVELQPPLARRGGLGRPPETPPRRPRLVDGLRPLGRGSKRNAATATYGAGRGEKPADEDRRHTMQRYYLTDEQRMVMELARTLAREKIAPGAAHHDELESYPEEAMRLLGQQGLCGVWVPEVHGGTGLGALALSLVAEEIAWACAATATNWGASALGSYPIVLTGSQEQQRRYLPRVATGELLAAYSLSE